MGAMRFQTDSAESIPPACIPHIYIAGLDRIPLPSRIRLEDGMLSIERSGSESVVLYVPWEVPGHGVLVVATGTLRERPEPYRLPLELARGKIGQVRNQLGDWQLVGLTVPADVVGRLGEATRELSGAIAEISDAVQSCQRAERALQLALDAGLLLSLSYSEQALMIRRRATPRLPTWLGANLGHTLLDDYTAGQFLQTFNAACVPLLWREIETNEGSYYWDIADQQIEWCLAHKLTVCAGPLIYLEEKGIPDWLYVCDGDSESLIEFASEFVQATVNRYRGKVDLWIAAGRINTANLLSLSEEDKVRLTAHTIELIKSVDPSAQLTVSFDQPWAEYLCRRPNDFPPLHFADALLRAGLGLNCLMLEINVGYTPDGTLGRDPLEFARQIDCWSQLEVPLMTALTVPSDADADPLAQRRNTTLSKTWSSADQQVWINRYLPLLLARPSVHGILWNQLRDSEPHAFPHGGLFDIRRHPKPSLRQLGSLRQAHLQ
jgi:hypothetical protein